MAKVNGGDLVMRMLKREGVSHLFTLVGGHNFEFVNACLDLDIKVVDVRHEQQAVHMAEALARYTGQLGAVAVDGAPGLVNAVPGIQVANEVQAPVIILTAQGSIQGRDVGVMQAIDQLRLVRPITKWARTCMEIKRLPEYVGMAARHSRSGRPGPVFLDMPLEVLRGVIEESEAPFPENYRTAARAYGDPKLIREALLLLSQAKKPLVVAGSGCRWSNAGEELMKFVHEAGVPILTRNLARGFVPDDDPLCVGFMPSGAFGADAYLIIGTRLDWTIGYGRPPLFGPESKAVQVDIHPETIGRNRPMDVGIVGDAKAVLSQFNEMLPSIKRWEMDASWPKQAKGTALHVRQQAEEGLKLGDRPKDRPMHSWQLCKELSSFLSRDAITVVDGGYIAAFAMQSMDCKSPFGITWVGSTGHIGPGVSYAIAAKLAFPNRSVFALLGDGAFGLSGIEFDTAVRQNAPVVLVIANDAGWGEVREGQRRRYGDGRIVGTDLGWTRYDQLATALGGHGELVRTSAELRPALERAASSGKPAIVNVLTDKEQKNNVVMGMPWIIE